VPHGDSRVEPFAAAVEVKEIPMRRFLMCMSLPLLLLALPAHSETIPFNLEVGYRWVDVSGNEGVYKSQINEESGLLLRAFTMTAPGFRIDSSDLGASPTGSFRIEASQPGKYRLRLGYRQLDSFSDLPSFSNPLLDEGVFAGQHTLDRSRTMVDLDLDILPDRAIAPFIGYSWNRNEGPGQTTYFVGQDEFRLLQDLNEKDRELRAGTSFRFSKVYGQVTQGWRQFRGTELLSLAPGASNGNNSAPVLGNPVTAETIARDSRIEVDTPFTNAFVTVQPLDRVKVTGNYVRFAADADGVGDETVGGSFVSFLLSRDFSGLSESVTGRVKNRTWRGGARAEVVLIDGIDFLAGYSREHRELEGSSLINTLYLQSVTFGGLDPRDVVTVLNASNSLDRDEDIWSAGIAARALGPFSIRTEFRESSQEFIVTPDLAEIVVPGHQGGLFSRKVQTIDTIGTFAKAGFNASASWKNDRADTAVFRTDYLDRDRYRVRVGWATPGRKFGVGVSGEQVDQSNQSEIGFDGRFRQYTASVDYAPITPLRLRAGVSRFQSDTDILFRRPQNFEIAQSVHRENGRSIEGEAGLLIKKVTVDAGYSRFLNEGSVPFEIDRFRVRATVGLKGKTGLAAEWNHDDFADTDLPIADYKANRFGVFFTWTP
jgi:hypothetical protein